MRAGNNADVSGMK